MGSLLGGMMGGKGKAQQVDWKQLEKMMDYSAKLNRFNDVGLFGGTEWTENPDGTWKREHVIDEGLQPGKQALIDRFGSGAAPDTQQYQSPWQAQMDQIMQAKLANQGARHNVDALPQQPPQAGPPPGAGGPPPGQGGPPPGQGGPPPQAGPPPGQGGPPPGGPPGQGVPPQQEEMMMQALMAQKQQEEEPQQMRWR